MALRHARIDKSSATTAASLLVLPQHARSVPPRPRASAPPCSRTQREQGTPKPRKMLSLRRFFFVAVALVVMPAQTMAQVKLYKPRMSLGFSDNECKKAIYGQSGATTTPSSSTSALTKQCSYMSHSGIPDWYKKETFSCGKDSKGNKAVMMQAWRCTKSDCTSVSPLSPLGHGACL
eukprot:COSAG01_NODE_19037_length_1035_cov_1.014957_1_plen_177_part_00